MASGDRRLFIGANEDGTLGLGGPWAIAEIKGPATVNRGTATVVPSLIAEGNVQRKAVIIVNLSATVTIWIGPESAGLDEDTGFPIAPGGYFMDNIATNEWWGFALSPAAFATLTV